MLLGVVLGVVAIGVALLQGGSLDRLASTRFRHNYLLVAGLILQIPFDVWAPSWATGALGLAIVLTSYALVSAWLLANHALPGMTCAGAGLAANLVVIALNRGMPVSLWAARAAAQHGPVTYGPAAFGIKHEAMGPHTLLPWLGDVIPLPGTGEVFSAGDLAIAAGIVWLVYKATRRGVAARTAHT